MILPVSDQTYTPGWYPDPYGGAGLRWHDGDRWTEHVHPAVPQPAMQSTPQSPAMPSPAPGTAVPVTSVLPQAAAPAPAKRAWVLPVVIVGVVVVALIGVGAFAAVRWWGNRTSVQLTDVRPDTILGRSHIDDPRITVYEQQLRDAFTSVGRGQAGAYGDIDSGDIVLVGWVPTGVFITADDRKDFLSGVGRELGTADPSRDRTADGPLAGTRQCVGGTLPNGVTADACAWFRDGTGAVFVVEYDATPDSTMTDLATVVERLTSTR